VRPGRLIRDADGMIITPAVVLAAYAQGCFPMADGRHGRVRWYRPERRAIITWDRWQVPRSLGKVAKRAPYRLTVDRAFAAVMAQCAERASTWISQDIEDLYRDLHRSGVAHSVEAWRRTTPPAGASSAPGGAPASAPSGTATADATPIPVPVQDPGGPADDRTGWELVGGLYGLCLGGCFCGESMFHRADDAAKLCVMHLVDILRACGFVLLDCQQQTPHMERFGAYEVDDARYRALLAGCREPRPFPRPADIGSA
jgi:leucyl/phenylalanyl-tRNA--protein transferase